ncbi:autotransporter domain-containing protein [Bradyrhizobium erythrophlei]|uniref:autotransporter domain-containing protein n=1 Tax=Bradyrhizobium erythrophlei TaxID=1437360 RepID=UPI0035EF7849
MKAGARLALLALVSAGATVAWSGDTVVAQTTFSTIQAFGDSYADTGNLFRILGVPNPVTYPTGRFSGGTNFVDTTSQLLGIPQNNFAIGGAKTGFTNTVAPGIPGFAQEWQGFVASGRTIAPSDLVEISIGGNDARQYYQTGGTLAGVPAAATLSANQAIAGINALVGAGARNIVFTTGDVSQLPEAAGNPNAAIGSAYSQAYNSQMQVALAGFARAGVRVELLDIALLGNLIKANPAAYGVANVGACPLTCIGNPALQNQFLFYFDKVHLTSLGFTILGQYIVNRLNAPLTLPAQGDLGMSSAMGFASTLFGRLDTFRETSLMASAMNSYAQVTKAPYLKAPPLAAVSPWSFYMLGNGAVSDRQATVASNGFNLDSVGGTIGVEYRLNSNAFIGGAFDYSNPKARFFNNGGTSEANAYQIGGYGAWTSAHFFAQALATFGWQNYRNSRPGVVDTITSSSDGTSFVAAGKVGYLFDAGRTQIGPIGGLTYARAKVNGYTESGDPVLTLAVGQQTAETLIGSVGAQFRFPFMVNGRMINPYVNLTMDDDLIGNGRIIQFGATSAPLIVNNWNVPNTTSQHVYGRVAAGVAAPVSDTVALTANISQTFARQGGNDFYGNGGLKISF